MEKIWIEASFESNMESRIMLKTSCTRMISSETCRRDRETVVETLRGSGKKRRQALNSKD